MRELKLSQIWIYPIKSIGGIKLTQATVMPKGLEHDRRWMLVDEAGICLTQRVHALMAFFHPSLTTDHLAVAFKGESILIPLNGSPEGQPIEVVIWDDKVTAYEVSTDHSAWFSERMGMPCRLVYFPEANPRQIELKHSKPGEHVSLADAYPILIIGQASLDDLNARLTQQLSMRRFRPNFVFTGGNPFEEDTWSQFDLGEGKFEGVKPCARCVMTTIDPDTAVKGSEPLKTLARYRRWNNKIYFGQNVIARNYPVIKVGDTLNNIHYQEPTELLSALSSSYHNA